MKGPTICRFSFGMARRTAKPLPKSRTRGTITNSSASHDLLSPSTGSAEGIQLIRRSPLHEMIERVHVWQQYATRRHKGEGVDRSRRPNLLLTSVGRGGPNRD